MKKKYLILFIFVFAFSQIIYSQGKTKTFKDDNYKFTFSIPDNWALTKTEETNKKDVISYTFDSKKDSTLQIMVIAFKLETVKDLDDFIYVLEKDVSLNIPPKSGDYSSFAKDTYDGKYAFYKDLQFSELIYYYRTLNKKSNENYAYMLRFVSSNYNSKTEKYCKDIANTFNTTLE